MSVAQPKNLMIWNEASGTTVTDYGTDGGVFTKQQGTENTDFSWHKVGVDGSGHLDNDFGSYLDVVTKTTANLPYWTGAGAAPAADQSACNFLFCFTARGFDTAITRTYLSGGTGSGILITVEAPAGTGDFDLRIRARTTGGFGFDLTTGMTALTFGTKYTLSGAIKFVSAGANLNLIYKLGSNTTQTPADVSSGSDVWGTGKLKINVADHEGFTNQGGLDGKYFIACLDRGASTAWSSTDLASINSDPAGTITGWPASSGGSTTVVPGTPQRNRRHTGRYL